MKEKIVLLVYSTIVLFLSLLSISNSSHLHHLHHNIRRQSLPAVQLHPSPPPIERKYSAIEYDKDMLESVLKEVINDELSKIKGSSGGRGQDPLIPASRDILERLSLTPVAPARQSEQENTRTTWRPPPPPTTPQPSQFHHAVMVDRDLHARDALLLDSENSVGVKNLVDSTQRAVLNEGEKDTTNNNNHYRDLREELLLLEEKLRHEKSIRQKLEQQEQKLREERVLQERIREEKRKIEQLLAEEKARREAEEAKQAFKTMEKQRRQQERDEELSSSLPDSSDAMMERVRALSPPIVGEEDKWIAAPSEIAASSMDDGSLTPTSMILRHPSSLLAGKEFRPSPFSPMGSYSSPYSSRLPPPFGGPFGPRGSYFPPPHGPHGMLRPRHAIPLSPLGSFPGARPFSPLAPMIPPIGAHHPFASPSSLAPIGRYPPPPLPPPGQQSLHSMAAAMYPGLYGNTNQRSSGPLSIESDQKEKKNLKSQLVDFAINSILDFGMMNIVGSVLNKINAEPGTR